MAIQGAIPVAFEDVFPHGAFASGEVKEARDWDRSTRDEFVQLELAVADRESGEVVKLPVWLVTVHDGDPDATQTVTVQVVAKHQPVLPAPLAGSPFRPVELAGLAIEVYVNRDKCRPPRNGQHRCGGRPAFKYWAREIRPLSSAASAGNGSMAEKTPGRAGAGKAD